MDIIHSHSHSHNHSHSHSRLRKKGHSQAYKACNFSRPVKRYNSITFHSPYISNGSWFKYSAQFNKFSCVDSLYQEFSKSNLCDRRRKSLQKLSLSKECQQNVRCGIGKEAGSVWVGQCEGLFDRRVSQWTNSNHVRKPAVVRSLNTKPYLDYPKFKSTEEEQSTHATIKMWIKLTSASSE